MPDDIAHLRTLVPPALQALIQDRPWRENTIGCTVARVFQIGDDLYLKMAPRDHLDLRREHDCLLWLHGKLPVPQVRYFGEIDAPPGQPDQFLLITALPGIASFDAHFEMHRPQATIRLLAEALRQIHAVPIDDCPFDRRAQVLYNEAEDNLRRGFVDAEEFDAPWRDRSAEELLAELQATLPPDDDLVLVHGDYCMPNILIDPDTITLSGFIDWGGAGVGDRCVDLALAARSITMNWGVSWVAPFFAAYRVAAPDPAKMRWYLQVDEFF
jgi:aminoglycoside phosphotransferase